MIKDLSNLSIEAFLQFLSSAADIFAATRTPPRSRSKPLSGLLPGKLQGQKKSWTMEDEGELCPVDNQRPPMI